MNAKEHLRVLLEKYADKYAESNVWSLKILAARFPLCSKKGYLSREDQYD
jgi:hypothetical protein